MKSLLTYLIFALMLFSKISNGQTNLSAIDSSVYFSADTTFQNSTLTFGVEIQNNSPATTFAGNLTVQIYNDSSGTGGFGTLIPVDSSYLQGATINAGSSVFISDSINVNSSSFRNGINTVVIWPVAGSSSSFSTKDTARYNIFVIEALSIKQDVKKDKIILYPNPTSAVIWICYSEKNHIEQVRILNALGQEILNQKNLSFNRIDLKDYPTGIYFIELRDTEGKLTLVKAIKE